MIRRWPVTLVRMRLLYFAWVRERIGVASESLDLPDDVTTVGALLEWLRGQGDRHAQALREPSTVRVAVNQEYAGLDAPVRNGDEVALFPPVTGG